jgi:tyrosine-protein phosphatase non-receptor type 14/21
LLPSYRQAPSYEAVMMEKSRPESTNRLSSTSTPNLAFPSHRVLIYPRGTGSSPDLVSSRNILHNNYHPPLHANSEIFNQPSSFMVTNKHVTYENLNQIEIPVRHSMFPLKHIPSNLLYPTLSEQQAVLLKQYHQHRRNSHNLSKDPNFLMMGGQLSEPIYENFPMQPDENKKNNSQVDLNMRTNVNDVNIVKTTGVQVNHRRIIEVEPPTDSEIKKQQEQHSSQQAQQVGNILMQRDINLNNIKILSQPELCAIRPEIQNNDYSKKTSDSPSTTLSSVPTESSNDKIDGSFLQPGTSGKKEKEEKKHKIWDFLSAGSKPLKYFNRNSGDKKKNKSTEFNNNNNQQNSTLRSIQKLQPLSSTISKENLCQILEMKLNDPELYFEFERISKGRENVHCSCALLIENRNKNNENTKVLPMDENRVKLTPSRDNRFGYVNASHVTVISL